MSERGRYPDEVQAQLNELEELQSVVADLRAALFGFLAQHIAVLSTGGDCQCELCVNARRALA